MDKIILTKSCSFIKNPRFNKYTDVFHYDNDETSLDEALDNCINSLESTTPVTSSFLVPYIKLFHDRSRINEIVDFDNIVGIIFGNYNNTTINSWFVLRDTSKKNNGYYLFIHADKLVYYNYKYYANQDNNIGDTLLVISAIVLISVLLTFSLYYLLKP